LLAGGASEAEAYQQTLPENLPRFQQRKDLG
jgi:hypothetical protein